MYIERIKHRLRKIKYNSMEASWEESRKLYLFVYVIILHLYDREKNKGVLLTSTRKEKIQNEVKTEYRKILERCEELEVYPLLYLAYILDEKILIIYWQDRLDILKIAMDYFLDDVNKLEIEKRLNPTLLKLSEENAYNTIKKKLSYKSNIK